MKNKPWAEPIVAPRSLLAWKYAALLVVGVAVWVAESPSLVDVASVFWNTLWGAGMITASAVAVVASARARWEGIERIAASVISALLVGFAAAPIYRAFQGNLDVVAYSSVAVALAIFPGWRALHLIHKLVRRA